MTSPWPTLSYQDAKDTYQTLQLWTQIVGKIKIVTLPWLNHSWHVTLYVTPRGLTTSRMDYLNQHFQIDFDFIKHELKIGTSTGKRGRFPLKDLSVAEFYHTLFALLKDLGITLKINRFPNELEEIIPFDEDNTQHATYQPEHVTLLHKSLLEIEKVFIKFRAAFTGKCSPIHLFWGSFDLAVTRFSGRPAPLHPRRGPHLPDWIAQEAYSHEVSSAGFWPGNPAVPFAAFYAYFYPEPEGYAQTTADLPPGAYYHQELREFILPYQNVQVSSNPEQTLFNFLKTTYQAGASLANWDNFALNITQSLSSR